MRKVIYLAAMVALFAALASCGGQKEEPAESTEAAQHDGDDNDNGQDVAKDDAEASPGLSPQTPTGEPITMIPDEEFSEFEKLAGASLRPYFDEAATQTEISVSPGDYFDMWVIAEFEKTHPMSACEYKLDIPEGIDILGTTHSDSIVITMGKADRDFMAAFRCAHGPKMWVVKYQCKVGDDFKGGKVMTTKGQDLNFLGFTMCDAAKTMIRARPGEATITRN